MEIVVFDGVAYGMLLFLIGVGLSVTMGLMNFVNLAHGALAMVGAYVASLLMNRWGLGFAPALVAACMASAVTGALLEATLLRRVYRLGHLEQVLFSIGLVFVAIAAFTFWFGPSMQPFAAPQGLNGEWRVAGLGLGRYRLFLIAFGAGVFALLMLGLGRTRYGAMVRAAVDNPRVAAATGIHVQRLFLLTFALGSGLAGLGGALSLGVRGLVPTFALDYLVYFLIVVCVGGSGTIVGPFVAAIAVGIVDVGSRFYLPQAGALPVYLFMVLMLLWRPQGIVACKGRA